MTNPAPDMTSLQSQLQADEDLIDALIEEVESLDNLLSPEAQDLVKDLRPLTITDDVYETMEEHETLGDRVADKIALLAGSWAFIGSFAVFMLIWIGINTFILTQAFDPYPFILLNLGLSTLAGLQAAGILMSQNRQAAKDRAVAENDFQVNLKSELEIADLHRKMDKLTKTLDNHTQLLNSLVALRQQDAVILRSLGGTSHPDSE